MTTMIRKSRAIVAASILTAVIMSFPLTTSQAIVPRELRAIVTGRTSEEMVPRARRVVPRVCPIDWRQSTWHVRQLIGCAASHFGVEREKALYIAWRESRYRPSAYNPGGDAAGIYQHLLKYWPGRAETFGFEDRSAFNARANIFVTMRMVRRYGWAPWGG
jgi:hypothetical protein